MLARLLPVLLFFRFSVFINAYNISINQNRGFLFGDVLEPLCSVSALGDTLTRLEVIELFHSWERFTSSQLGSASIAEYRKAMPCFPGPTLDLTDFSEEMLPRYPNCEVFVNISTSTMEEAEDLLKEVQNGPQRPLDVSLKSVMNSLGNRLRNLIDYLPDGGTRNKTETLLTILTHINTLSPPITNPSAQPLDFSALLSCFNLTTLPNLSTDQTIGSLACSLLSICSYSSLSANQCLAQFNISEQMYEEFVNKSVGELIGGKMGKMVVNKDLGIGRFFGDLGRFKRTPKPESWNSTESEDSEDFSGTEPSWSQQPVKMDGREEGSGDGPIHHHSFTFDPEEFLNSEDSEGSAEDGSGSEEDDIMNILKDEQKEKGSDLQSSLPPDNHDLESLLATKLNTSILEYGASFVNDTALKLKVAMVVPSLGSEFTVGQLMEKLGVTDVSKLMELLNALRSVLGDGVPEVSELDLASLKEKLSASTISSQQSSDSLLSKLNLG